MNEPIIIALSGKKGSGKNTIASFIHDYFSREWYSGLCNGIDFCQEYAFADGIKEFCIDVLGLEHRQCYGTEEKKNTPTKYKWENVPKLHIWKGMSDPEGFMTGREVMQIFGTESVRAWFGNVWAEATLRRICKTRPALAIITDNRFPSEVETILGHPSGHIVRLTRSPFEGDQHTSETSLDDFDWSRERCYVLDNASLNKEKQQEVAIPILEAIFRQELTNE